MWHRPMLRGTLSGVLAICAVGCGSSHRSAAATPATPMRCRSVSLPAPRPTETHLRRPSLRLSRSHTYTVALLTNCGTFVIGLDVQRAPRIAASFAYLVRRGFYDGLAFHRVVPGFVIQGGDPLGSGRGGPGYTVVERPPAGIRYTSGDVAMAKTQLEPPGASGSQFFIVTAPDAKLPPDYAILGRVLGGADTVSRMAAVPTGGVSGDEPQQPVVIEKATLVVR